MCPRTSPSGEHVATIPDIWIAIIAALVTAYSVVLVVIVLALAGALNPCRGPSPASDACSTARTPAAPTTTTVPLPPALANGQTIYRAVCASCHAADLSGVPALGTPLRPSQFIEESSPQTIADYTIRGSAPTDPDNATGQAMPARGGNMALSDKDLLEVAEYLKLMQP